MTPSDTKRRPLPPVGDALRQVLARSEPVDPVTVPLSEAAGRVLLEDITVPLDQPPFDRSAMDGYALAGETPDRVYALRGIIAAGSPTPPSLLPGQCARIFTGAPVPEGADRVAIQEECTPDGNRIHVNCPVKPGGNIRRRGEDARSGDLALAKGQRLEAPQIGLAASLGKNTLVVARKPLVWILPTGTELVEPGQPLRSGQIYNSNAPQLAAQIRSLGGCARISTILGDDSKRIADDIRKALDSKADIICVSGGASVGDADYTRTAIEQCGFTTLFHGVDLKPGKPVLFAIKDRCLVFGIPGNPVSHLVVFALLIAPAIRSLLGLPPREWSTAELKESWQGKTDARDRWLPSRVEQDGSRAVIRILPWKGSGDLMSCRQANAIANLPGVTTVLPEGAKVICAPLSNDG